MEQLNDILHTIVAIGVPLVLAITLHEVAHGYAADRLGDPTARRMGRLSLDPLRHIDPFGTVILPGMMILSGVPFLFGYAKPVPVDTRYFTSPIRHMALVALAGPAANMAQAFVAALILYVALAMGGAAGIWLQDICIQAIKINCLLAVFNMIPLPPLDGSHVLRVVLPAVIAQAYERLYAYGMPLLLALVMVPFLSNEVFGVAFNPLWMIIEPMYEFALTLVVTVTGHV